MKKWIFILMMLIIPSLAHAHVTETGKITQIITEGSNNVSVWLDGTDDTSLCSGGSRWTVDDTDPLFKEKYSLLLVAVATGRTIKLEHLDTMACGNWSSNKIYFVAYYR